MSTIPAKPPKVFISHASEDKARFVLAFAERLLTNGVDAWLDKWEMHTGDSLVDKIFEEGVKDASAFIIVLSKISVDKPWVREELNAAFVKRLSDKCRIIPLVLDDCEVPQCLKSTLWQRIDDLGNYDDAFKGILNAIFGLSEKPPIGPSPAHARMSPLLNIPSLHKVDLLVFETLCEESVRANDTRINDLSCLDAVAAAGVSDEEIRDSLKILSDEYYLELSRVMGTTYRDTHVASIRIHTQAFDQFARAKWPEYESYLERLVGGLVNENWRSQMEVAKLGAPARLTDHLVRFLEDNNHIRVSRYFGGYSIFEVSPRLKRALAEK